MSIKQNKDAVYKLNQAINSGDLSILPDLFHHDYVFHINPEVKGVDGITQFFSAQLCAYPDYNEQINFMVAEGDLVAVFYTISGSFPKAFRGIALTGESFCCPICVLARFEDGKQTDAWPYYDTMEAFKSLGKIKGIRKSRLPVLKDAYTAPQTVS